MKELLSGNKVIACGAYEVDIKLTTPYQNTPVTEILQNISKYKEINKEIYSKRIY